MYKAFYGLKEKPFDLHPDPEYVYMSKGHENAYTHLEYAVTESKGFVVVTGEIGSGKTTLINYLLGQIPQYINTGLINNTYVSPNQFFKLMCREFELEIDGLGKSEMIEVFQEFLLEQYSKKKRVILIVDEAQNLTPKTLEEIRMLSNLESEKNHLIQIILVGQPELKFKLQRKDLAQFAQRVTVHCHLNGMTYKEVEQYINYRLSIAGAADKKIFNDEAVKMIFEYSRGIPRLINILCDTALVYGFADGIEVVDRKVIDSVINERAAGGLFNSQIQVQTSFSDLSALTNVPARAEGGNNGVGNTANNAQISSKINQMENRLNDLEKKVVDMEQHLVSLLDVKDEKNLLMLDLFKLLKQSMENRFETLIKITSHKRN